MPGGGLLQQVVERHALLVIERREQLVLDLAERRLRLTEARGPGVGEPDEMAPPVLDGPRPAISPSSSSSLSSPTRLVRSTDSAAASACWVIPPWSRSTVRATR